MCSSSDSNNRGGSTELAHGVCRLRGLRRLCNRASESLRPAGRRATSQSIGCSSKGERHGDEKVARSGCCPGSGHRACADHPPCARRPDAVWRRRCRGGEGAEPGAGIALLAWGVACWPGREAGSGSARSIGAMLTYSLLVTLYLVYLGVIVHLAGMLLWPGVAVHAVWMLLLVKAWRRERQSPGGSAP